MNDYATASALGDIAGTLRSMSIRASADKLFADVDSRRASSQELQIERAVFRKAYNELSDIAVNLDNEVQRLNGIVNQQHNAIAERDELITQRDQLITQMQAASVEAEEYIAALKRTVSRLANPPE
jgi:DNA-binding transcriptional regulator YhcF (GntR family)